MLSKCSMHSGRPAPPIPLPFMNRFGKERDAKTIRWDPPDSYGSARDVPEDWIDRLADLWWLQFVSEERVAGYRPVSSRANPFESDVR